MTLQIWPVPIFSDNYCWVLQHPERERVAVVDPGEAHPVSTALAERNLEVAAILITHHHRDHTGGVDALMGAGAIPVYAPRVDCVAQATHELAEGDLVSLDFLDLQLTVLAVPGHTRGHVVYYGAGILLSGDALFAGGCGRVFEGTMEQMNDSLTRLAALPPETRVYCAHEYTEANLRFAAAVEPDNRELSDRRERVTELRRADEPTIPSTMAEELATNPFLRCREAAVVRAAEEQSGRQLTPGPETFAVIRRWKDSF